MVKHNRRDGAQCIHSRHLFWPQRPLPQVNQYTRTNQTNSKKRWAFRRIVVVQWYQIELPGIGLLIVSADKATASPLKKFNHCRRCCNPDWRRAYCLTANDSMSRLPQISSVCTARLKAVYINSLDNTGEGRSGNTNTERLNSEPWDLCTVIA